jgi:hypothetical protein
VYIYAIRKGIASRISVCHSSHTIAAITSQLSQGQYIQGEYKFATEAPQTQRESKVKKKALPDFSILCLSAHPGNTATPGFTTNVNDAKIELPAKKMFIVLITHQNVSSRHYYSNSAEGNIACKQVLMVIWRAVCAPLSPEYFVFQLERLRVICK